MKYKAILFDLDGTLLPMDMQEFTNGYFRLLGKKIREEIEPELDQEQFVKAVWSGTRAMAKNPGTKTNRDVFWEVYDSIMGTENAKHEAVCDAFYDNEFRESKRFTGENPLAVKAVQLAHEKAEQVILSTNPYFPMQGQVTRMSFVGLKPEDFDLVTEYATDCFCKPNPGFFHSICERMNLKPEECLVIGNDELEDMYCASQAGMDGYLVTDCSIPSDAHPYEGPKGSFADLVEMLQAL